MKHLLRLVLLFLMIAPSLTVAAAELELQPNDHICLVGNELGERMQHENHWESLLYQRFPNLQLTVRNLCFPGDEPDERIRSQNFGEPDVHLRHSGATVVLYFFGFNESFGGERGLGDFTEEMTRLVEETRAQDYSGSGAPRVVLVSPIAFENTGDRNLPDGSQQNTHLEMYTAALSEVARETGCHVRRSVHANQNAFRVDRAAADPEWIASQLGGLRGARSHLRRRVVRPGRSPRSQSRRQGGDR